jgi:asparagine synthetase A
MQHVLLTSINSADTAIYTYAPIINRDGATINESIVNYNIYIEMYASHAIVLDDLINQIANNFMAGVKKVNLELNINKDKLPEYTNQSINFITIDKLIKTYPSVSLKEAIDRYTISNGATAVIGACREIEGKSLFVGLPTADDYDHTTVLYVLNETNNTATPIVKISSRPKIEVINKQILEYIPEVMDANIYQETILKERNDEQNTIGVTVYFSNIMLINLKKYHISEVVHAP